MHQQRTLNPVPYGYCHCRCGEKTKPAVSNYEARGLRKGEPQKFLAGHSRKASIHEEDRGYVTPCHIGEWKPEGKGYCRTRVDGVRIPAHRYYYERVNGPIPDGHEIDHLCYQRDCVNPAHMEAVTGLENQRRRRDRKLTPADALAIRLSPLRNDEAAKEFGVSRTHVAHIRSGRAYPDVGGQ